MHRYVVYLGECWHSQACIDLRSAVDVSVIYQQIRAMRQSPPVVWWRAVCYHYARRLRQVRTHILLVLWADLVRDVIFAAATVVRQY